MNEVRKQESHICSRKIGIILLAGVFIEEL